MLPLDRFKISALFARDCEVYKSIAFTEVRRLQSLSSFLSTSSCSTMLCLLF
jgi:hypothetical protein